MKELKKALTFDDILLVPAHSEVLPKQVSLTSKLTNKITLQTPIISAAMDTVTEGKLAIALRKREEWVSFIKTCLLNLKPKK